MKILESQMENIVSGFDNRPRILNVGAATGATSQMLERFGDVTTMEYDEECCKFLKEKLQMDVTQASLTDLPYGDGSYDIICAFDVIEHIENHQKAMCEIDRVLSDKGFFFITVPAFQFLWSNHDEVNHHFRRYTRSELESLISGTQNLSPIRFSYFNTWLFIPVMLTRMFLNLFPRKAESEKSGSDFEVMNKIGLLNALLYYVFLSENFLLKHRFKLPVGISLYGIGTKASA
jgi:SAM-dependent methyltransferase